MVYLISLIMYSEMEISKGLERHIYLWVIEDDQIEETFLYVHAITFLMYREYNYYYHFLCHNLYTF